MLAGRGARRTTNKPMHTGGIRTGSRKRCMPATIMHTIRTIMTTITAMVTTMGTAVPIKAAAVAEAVARQSRV